MGGGYAVYQLTVTKGKLNVFMDCFSEGVFFLTHFLLSTISLAGIESS